MTNPITNDIIKNGFLAREITQQVGEFNLKYKDLFTIAYEQNVMCQEFKFKAKAKKDQPKKIYLLASFLRALDLYASIIILLERGLYKDSAILLRTLFEVTVYMKKTVTDENFIRLSHEANILIKSKMLQEVLNCSDLAFKESFSEEFLNEARKAIKDALGEKTIKDLRKLNLEQLAKDPSVNLEKEYIQIYRVFSSETHGGYNSIHDYLNFDENGSIKEFQVEHPQKIGLNVLILNILLLGYCCEVLINKFEIDHTEFVKLADKINSKFKELA